MSKVAIVLATYNPDPAFLEIQINSIKNQNFQNWICFISDESRDPAARQVLEALTAKDSRFHLIPGSGGGRGAFYNFERGLKAVSEDCSLVAFCDQDDFWEPVKLETMMHDMQSHPGIFLTHSDLKLIDHAGKEINPSCWSYESRDLRPEIPLGDLVLRNSVTGCSMMFRSELLKWALPFPADVKDEYLHDQWLALLARLRGPFGVIPQTLIRYRQHSANVVGAQSSQSQPIWVKLKKLGQISSKGEKALRIREKLASDLKQRIQKIEAEAGPAISHEALRQLEPILNRHQKFYFSYLVKSLGKRFETGLGLQLFWGSFKNKPV